MVKGSGGSKQLLYPNKRLCRGIFQELKRPSSRRSTASLYIHNGGGNPELGDLKARSCGLIQGLRAGSNGEDITHLQFVDDTLVFIENEEAVVDNVMCLFRWFELVYGLRINFAKSKMVGINVDSEVVQRYANSIGCEAGSFPITYLGLPIVRIERKLASWKRRCISMGGRITLIKAGLGSMLIYFMSLFKISVKVARRIEKLQRDFLWEGDGQSKKLKHLLNWKCVSKLKKNGGLGI
ncbi:uncharacterized protein LOC143893065 [Tasmannia lanceolata]|uniref:uncharacterized protein LOC143893065 n=1 Tax=Tasmannia lanceolata TaxID=3420 RepID=UPI004063E8FB